MEQKRTILYATLSIGLSILFNVFFIFSRYGISMLVFNVIFICVGYYCLKKQEGFNRLNYLIGAVTVIILSIPFFRFDLWLFKTMNVLLIAVVYGYMVQKAVPFKLFGFILQMTQALFLPIGKLTSIFTDTLQAIPGQKKIIGKWVIGLLLAFFMLIIVIPLLVSSDVVFGKMLVNTFDFIRMDDIGEIIFRTIFFVLVAAYFYTHLARKLTLGYVETSEKQKPLFDLTISNVFLVCVNVVYVFYCFIQVKYLFLGSDFSMNMTFSEYARQGFFQLVYVTVLNILVIILFQQFKKHHASVNILLTITVLCTYIMSFSAFYRMNLYEDAYGYTQLRLLVFLFIIGEWVTLIPLVAGLYLPKMKALEMACMTLFVYYLGISFINIDGFVAKRNLERALESDNPVEALDTYYLYTLSLDIVGVVEKYEEKLPDEIYQEIHQNIKDDYENSYESRHWYEMNLTGYKTKSYLENH